MSTSKLKSSCNRSIGDLTSKNNIIELPRSKKPLIQNFFLPYQMKGINESYPFAVWEKGRRVGMSEALSYRSARNAAFGIKNTYYSTYNLPASSVFLKKVAKWAKALNKIYRLQYNRDLIDEKNGINKHRVEFLNGYFVEAIPDTANSFRDKESFGTTIIKDEAAFSKNLGDILEAVKALNMWSAGSEIIVLSTHYGDENDFNKLVRSVKANPKLGHFESIPFSYAVDQGLYRKICELTDKVWTPNAEREYIDYWLQFYGDSASQELEAIPRKYGGSKVFHESVFHYVEVPKELLDNALKIRTWDFAATSKEKAKEGTFYTATVLAAVLDDTLIIMDVEAHQYSPDDVEAWIIQQSQEDDPLTTYVLEEEPGSTGKFFINHMEKLITNRNVSGYSPPTSKLVRAVPLIASLKNDRIVLLNSRREHLDKWLIKPMTEFDGSPIPLTNDVTDCMSMLHGYWETSVADWLAA